MSGRQEIAAQDGKIAREVAELIGAIQLDGAAFDRVSVISERLEKELGTPAAAKLSALSALELPLATAASELAEILAWKVKLSGVLPAVKRLSKLTIRLPEKTGGFGYSLDLPPLQRPLTGLELLRFEPERVDSEGRLPMPRLDGDLFADCGRVEVCGCVLEEPLPLRCKELQLSSASWRSEALEARELQRLEIESDWASGDARMLSGPRRPVPGLVSLSLRGLSRDLRVFAPWFSSLEELELDPIQGDFGAMEELPRVRGLAVSGKEAAVEFLSKTPNVQTLVLESSAPVAGALGRLKSLREVTLQASREEIWKIWTSNRNRFDLRGTAIEIEIREPGEEEYRHTYRFHNGEWAVRTELLPWHKA